MRSPSSAIWLRQTAVAAVFFKARAIFNFFWQVSWGQWRVS
jgi:hypothetical protein